MKGMDTRRDLPTLMTYSRAIYALSLLFMNAGCGDAAVASRFLQTADIGPAGGSLIVSAEDSELDQAELRVPAGALDRIVTITVEPGSPVGLSGGDTAAGPAARFGPEGLSFRLPATLTLPLFRAPGAEETVRVHAMDADGSLRVLESELVVQGDRVSALVEHFTTFQPGSRTSAARPDAGVGDGGMADVGPVDTGVAPDLGPPDVGPRDVGSPDHGPGDTGIRDTGPADAGSARDMGGTLSLTVATSSVSNADACASTRQTLRASRSGRLQWRLLTFAELFALDPRTPPIGSAAIDAATGELTLDPELTAAGVVRAVGVEVVDPSDGSTDRRAWSYLVNGVNAYQVASGGPAVFVGSASLPTLSKSSPSTYRPIVATATHPCSVTYGYSRTCSPGTAANPFLQIFPPTGELTVVTAIDFLAPGPYCIAARAEVNVAGQPVALESRTLQFNVIP